jgi:hypothetical protein
VEDHIKLQPQSIIGILYDNSTKNEGFAKKSLFLIKGKIVIPERIWAISQFQKTQR